MGEATGIAWTDATWNSWVGCAKVSAGCKNCYMFAEQKRYGQDPTVVRRTQTWRLPVRLNKRAAAEGVRRKVFTCSWSDFFIAEADPWRVEAWDLIRACEYLDFLVLTKRPERIGGCLPADWGDGYPNVWLGVSAEDQATANRRLPLLRATPARVRFVSFEPLLGPIDLELAAPCGYYCDESVGHVDHSIRWLDWVIAGGEGEGARPCRLSWLRALRDQCAAAGVPFFLKQLGACAALDDGVGSLALRDRKGGDPAEWPPDLRVREWPGKGALNVSL